MRTPPRFCSLLAFLAATASHVLAAEEPLPQQARAALEQATTFMRSIATSGGYLWTYSPDLTQRAGERPATSSQIWVQPPGTPAVGQVFLRAYEVTGERRYLDAAEAAADALATGQLESGGWDYVIDFDPAAGARWHRRTDAGRISAAEAARRMNVSTYDDDNTQSALRLLLAVSEATRGSNSPAAIRIRAARDYGFAKLLAAQLPTGGWPQRWNGAAANPADYPVRPARIPTSYPREQPLRHNYQGYPTLNDNTQRDCVMTLLEAANRLNRPDYRAAALKGGDFLLLAQLPEPQPVWAQQYNPQLEPAWARAFEPPSVCSNESVGALRLLIDLHLETGDEKYLEPIPRALAWFQRSAIAPNKWARMYELHTNRPIYGDRDGKIHYTLEELSPERQTGYSWQGDYGLAEATTAFEQVTKAGRAAVLAQRKAALVLTPAQKAARTRSLERRVREVIAALDGQGRWIAMSGGREQIRTDAFIRNVEVLTDYLQAVK